MHNKILIDWVKGAINDCVSNMITEPADSVTRAVIRENVCEFMRHMQREQMIHAHSVESPAVTGYVAKTHRHHTTCVFLLSNGKTHIHKHKFSGRRLARVHGKRTWKSLMVCDIRIQPIIPVNHITIQAIIGG